MATSNPKPNQLPVHDSNRELVIPIIVQEGSPPILVPPEVQALIEQLVAQVAAEIELLDAPARVAMLHSISIELGAARRVSCFCSSRDLHNSLSSAAPAAGYPHCRFVHISLDFGDWLHVPNALVQGAVVAFLLSLASHAAAQDRYEPVLAGLSARCIGPANMGGRIADLAVVESNPAIYYVAAASGGVWKTTDGGTTFKPIFDEQPTQSIGAVAVCQGKPDVVYVGTGEGNPRNSVSWGSGVYRSADGGKTWKNCGLADTHHIGRVVVHPTNPDIAYVAALGHCWGANKERGLYKTTDGGKSWENVNFIDENTGFVDVCMDPSEPDTLYAAAWPMRRDGFSGGSPVKQTGATGGLFKTSDGGKTWEKMAGGLPEKVGYGRCGLAVYAKDPKVVYAVVQTSETVGALTNAGQPPTPVGKNGQPGTPGKVVTGGVFRSEDKGETWKKVNDLVPRPFYYGQIRIDPSDDKRIYVLGVQFHASSDGGKSFTTIARTIHPDHHALWINPKDGQHLIVGNDGGLFTSKDRGQTFTPNRGLVISQFYGVAVDTRTPYRVYGGLQDNGSWGGPTATHFEDGITQSDWRRLLAADGFQAAVDPTDPNTVYVESQFGGLNRVSLRGGPKGPLAKPIRPLAPKGGIPNRYNWNSPILLSPHDPKALYYGAQFLFKSTNRGDTWERISADLTAPTKEEAMNSAAHTVLALAESPVQAGVLWVGTDDGKLWVTKDDGKNWSDVSDKLPGPKARAISKIECSHFTPGTAMVAVDRHRNDDFKPYLYVTLDFGETWRAISGNLPAGAVVGVVRQSAKDKFVLFAGTELGLYVTFDAGTKWYHLTKTGLPANVRVDDLVIHPKERELVIGTHGRGIWVMDIAPLEQLAESVWKAGRSPLRRETGGFLQADEANDGSAAGVASPEPAGGHPGPLPDHGEDRREGGSDLHQRRRQRVGRYLGKETAGLDSCVFDIKEAGEYTITLEAWRRDAVEEGDGEGTGRRRRWRSEQSRT